MLVTFTTKAYADITMFGEVARAMLRMMGHSDTVPGAILADDVPGELESLKKSVESISATQAESASKDDARDERDERPVSIAHRALPLIELLTAAARQHADVMWK